MTTTPVKVDIATVYRCGSMHRSMHRSDVVKNNAHFDAVKPEGRVGRSEAIFTSAYRDGLEQWIPIKLRRKERRARMGDSPLNMFDHDTMIRHIDVRLDDSLYVYDSEMWWEVVQQIHDSRYGNGNADASRYWNSGIPLLEWINTISERSVEDNMNSELLIAPRHVHEVRVEDMNLAVESYEPLPPHEWEFKL